MMNHEEANKRRVTLEDLLQLKRAERPAPEFWERFERELRAKQLAAIVERRPWWRTLPHGFSGMMRYRLPLGASAILVVTFLSVREYQAVATAPRPSSTIAVATPALVNESPSGVNEVAPMEVARLSSPLAGVDHLVSNSSFSAVPVVAEESGDRENLAGVASADATEGVAEMVPWLMAAKQPESSIDLSPAAKSIADNLAVAREAHPELASRFLGSVGGFEKRGMPAPRQTIDPLAQMRSPADLHRERLLASALPVASQTSGRTSERITRRISDERLTEEAISRFGARGDRVLVKF